MIKTEDLTKQYGKLFALKNLTLELNEGDLFGFIGPNGSGKTTTMKMLATLLQPTYGEAYVCAVTECQFRISYTTTENYIPEECRVVCTYNYYVEGDVNGKTFSFVQSSQWTQHTYNTDRYTEGDLSVTKVTCEYCSYLTINKYDSLHVLHPNTYYILFLFIIH